MKMYLSKLALSWTFFPQNMVDNITYAHILFASE